MNQQTAQVAAAVLGAAVASAPAWAMYFGQRADNRRHAARLTALHEKVDRLAPTSVADKGGGAAS